MQQINCVLCIVLQLLFECAQLLNLKRFKFGQNSNNFDKGQKRKTM